MMTGFGKFLKSKADDKKEKKTKGQETADEDDILAQTFKKFDKDSSGFLDAPEMLKAMQDIMGPKVTNSMVDRVMTEIDKDKSGTVELEEFYDFFEKIDDLVRNGFGSEMEAANGGGATQASSVGGGGGGGGGIPQAALDELLAKIAEIQDAQNKGMEKMQKELKDLQDEQKKQTDALRQEVSGLKNELLEVKSIATSLREKDLKKKERREGKKGAEPSGDGEQGAEELS